MDSAYVVADTFLRRQFSPQPADQPIHSAVDRFPITPTLYGIHDLIAVQHQTAMFEQSDEQIEFRSCQFNFSSIRIPNLPSVNTQPVSNKGVISDDRIGWRRYSCVARRFRPFSATRFHANAQRTAQHRVNTRTHLPRPKGLGYVVVSTKFQSDGNDHLTAPTRRESRWPV